MSDRSVRPAVVDDVPGIIECYLRAWRAAYESEREGAVLDQEAEKRRSFDWRLGIESDAAAVFVVADGARILGVVQADLSVPEPRDLPEISMLYVDPDAWGTRTAAALLDAGVDWVRHSGVSSVRLRVVETHGRPRRFYEREGWTVDPDLPPASNDWFRLIYYRRNLNSFDSPR